MINDGTSQLKDLVDKENNIWACIYRGINKKRENNDFDEEEEEDIDGGFKSLNTMQDNNTQFLQDSHNGLTRSSTDKRKSIYHLSNLYRGHTAQVNQT